MKSRDLLAGSAVLAGLAALSISAPAAAQDAPEPEASQSEEIVVTGTRVANPNLEAASQILVVDSEEIALQNVNSAEELLRQLPGSVPSVGPAVNNGNGGAQTINLRGIGSNRNIVLLDSRRIVPFGLTGVTDLNHIPVALLERVDVVTGGASSVYGADAVSGVFNFITKNDFEGVELTTSYRETEERDGESRRVELVMGTNTADGKGNVALGFGYQDTKEVLQGNRSFGLFNISSVTGNRGGSSAAVPTVLAVPGFTGQYNPDTTTFDAGFTPFNFNPLNLYQTPVERFNIFAKGHYDLFDSVEAYAEGFFTRSNVRTQLAPSATFFNTYALPLNNPFLSDAGRDQICGLLSISEADCDAAGAATNPEDVGYQEVNVGLRRRFVEFGPRFSEFQTDAFQIAGGLRGDLPRGWQWNLGAQYGESDLVQSGNGYLFSRVQQALRATDVDTCVDPSNGCVPLNLFGPEGSLNAEEFLLATTFSFTETVLTTVDFTVSGDTGEFMSPFASQPIGLAFGAEYRDYQASSAGDFLAQQAGEILGAGGADPAIVGGYDTTEVFAEALVPLVTDAPFMKSLNIEAGYRRSDYSSTGESRTWKYGGTWEVNDYLTFRAVNQRAERSPNISELFDPVQTVLDNLATDPCAGAAPASDPALAALCIAQGAPASAIGLIDQPAAGQINVTTGGNPDLETEEADTLTIGVIARPLENLTLTLDYFDINIEGAVTSPAVGDILDGCFENGTAALCNLIERNPIDGSLNGSPADVRGVILQISNLGTIATKGFDFGANYEHDLGAWGRVVYNFVGTYTDENKFQATPTSVNRECVGFYSTDCGNIQPEYQFNQRVTWSVGRYDISAQHRYLSSVEIEPEKKGDFQSRFESIDAFNYVDMSIRAAITPTVEITGTIDNLFDVSPPIVGADVGPTAFNSGNTYPTVYDALGRSYTVAARLRF